MLMFIRGQRGRKYLVYSTYKFVWFSLFLLLKLAHNFFPLTYLYKLHFPNIIPIVMSETQSLLVQMRNKCAISRLLLAILPCYIKLCQSIMYLHQYPPNLGYNIPNHGIFYTIFGKILYISSFITQILLTNNGTTISPKLKGFVYSSCLTRMHQRMSTSPKTYHETKKKVPFLAIDIVIIATGCSKT